MNIDFVFDNEVENFENNYEQDFTAIIEQALKTLGIEDDVEVSCVLCLLYTSPSPRDVEESRMPSSA